MDYVEMLKDPELVYGFRELIGDTDPIVVKRTIKVFTSVYYHALRLLATGELEAQVFLKAWDSVKEVVDSLMEMIGNCENEGVLIHLLRFIEAAVTSHLMYDFSSFPEVFEKGREVVKNGLKALKKLITTPYVGGASFIVGIRALITIACLRPDLWEPVTDLLKKQMASLPPTLFDHNVRSLHKTLQRNLFRLLRRAEKPDLRAKLIEMMVSVGVPRKVVMPWAPPPPQIKKRPVSDIVNEASIVGRPATPPEKKLRIEVPKSHDNVEKPTSRSNTPDIAKDPRMISNELQQRPNERELPKQLSINANDSIKEFSATSKPAKEASPPAADRKIKSDFIFLASLLPKAFNKEKELYNVLTLDGVVDLVFEGLDYLPDLLPKSLADDFRKQAIISEDIDEMRKHLAYMLTKDLTDKNLKDLVFQAKNNRCKLPPLVEGPSGVKVVPDPIAAVAAPVVTPMMRKISPSSSCDSSPSCTPPLMDTDMRQLYNQQKPPQVVKDVDMRIGDPRVVSREAGSSKISDPRLNRDPRLVHQDPRRVKSASPDTVANDHRRMNRKSRWGDSKGDSGNTNAFDPRIQRNGPRGDPPFPMNGPMTDPRFRGPPPSMNCDSRFRTNLNVPPPAFGMTNMPSYPGPQRPRDGGGSMMMNAATFGWNNRNASNNNNGGGGMLSSQPHSSGQTRGPLLPTPMANFS